MDSLPSAWCLEIRSPCSNSTLLSRRLPKPSNLLSLSRRLVIFLFAETNFYGKVETICHYHLLSTFVLLLLPSSNRRQPKIPDPIFGCLILSPTSTIYFQAWPSCNGALPFQVPRTHQFRSFGTLLTKPNNAARPEMALGVVLQVRPTQKKYTQ